MAKKIIFVILGLIVAMIVIAECFSNAQVKSHASKIERKIAREIDNVWKD